MIDERDGLRVVHEGREYFTREGVERLVGRKLATLQKWGLPAGVKIEGRLHFPVEEVMKWDQTRLFLDEETYACQYEGDEDFIRGERIEGRLFIRIRGLAILAELSERHIENLPEERLPDGRTVAPDGHSVWPKHEVMAWSDSKRWRY